MPSDPNDAKKERLDSLIKSCAEPAEREVPGVGKVAKFDHQARPKAPQCEELYSQGGVVMDRLVRAFCDRSEFTGDNIPQRCKCYRFPDTADFEKYSSIWSQVVESAEDAAGNKQTKPFVSSYVCFYGECGNRTHAYLTEDMKADKRSCPTTVFCKQVVGGINVDGKSPAQIETILKQQCGAKVTKDPNDNKDPADPKDPKDPKDPETPQGLSTGLLIALVVGGAVILLLLVALLAASRN